MRKRVLFAFALDYDVLLPHAERAVIDLAKLRDYCLDPDHPEGKHKARVFQRALGLAQADARWLNVQLLAAAQREEAVAGRQDAYGQRYILDTTLNTHVGTATIRSSWIVRTGEDFPRLVTCYVL